METATSYRTSMEVARYTVGFKSFKKINPDGRVKMRQVRICRNGQWIYADTFKEEERARHEEWAANFLNAMKLRDTKQYLEQQKQTKSTQETGAGTTQAMLWNTILLLRGAGLMTNREAADICLVRFTWTQEQAEAKLQELQKRYRSAINK